MTRIARDGLALARDVITQAVRGEPYYIAGPGEAETLARAVLAMSAVVEAARLLSDAMVVGAAPGMRGLWCSTRNGPADHAALMLDLRAALAALGKETP